MSVSRITALGTALTALALLTGCGQKGPLYMPGDEQAAEQYDPADVYPEQPKAQPRTEGSTDEENGHEDNATTRGGGE